MAVAALALQLALSFGHDHFFVACSSHCGTAVASTIAKVNKISAEEPADSNGDYCAACASIQLADNTLPQTPYQLPSSFVGQTIEHAGYVAVPVSSSRHTLFQSRPPPLR